MAFIDYHLAMAWPAGHGQSEWLDLVPMVPGPMNSRVARRPSITPLAMVMRHVP